MYCILRINKPSAYTVLTQHVRHRNKGDGTHLTNPCDTEDLNRPHVGTSIVYGMGGGVDTLGGQVSDCTAISINQ